MRKSFYDYCLEQEDLGLLAQWHSEKNEELSPKDVSYGSKKKVWWRCEKGHAWQASVDSRVAGNGCPVCDGKVVVPGENDFASAFPEIAVQWHPTKNGTLHPQDITPYSNKKVWWICEKEHEYQAIVANRTNAKKGCPFCTNQKVLPGFNDLATTQPKIAAQWHPELNGDLTPQMVSAGSEKKVWWVCDEGHVWKAIIFSRTGPRKTGCPICSGNVRVRTKRY